MTDLLTQWYAATPGAFWYVFTWILCAALYTTFGTLAFFWPPAAGPHGRGVIAVASVAAAVAGLTASVTPLLSAFKPAATDARLGKAETMFHHFTIAGTGIITGAIIGLLGIALLYTTIFIQRRRKQKNPLEPRA